MADENSTPPIEQKRRVILCGLGNRRSKKINDVCKQVGIPCAILGSKEAASHQFQTGDVFVYDKEAVINELRLAQAQVAERLPIVFIAEGNAPRPDAHEVPTIEIEQLRELYAHCDEYQKTVESNTKWLFAASDKDKEYMAQIKKTMHSNMIEHRFFEALNEAERFTQEGADIVAAAKNLAPKIKQMPHTPSQIKVGVFIQNTDESRGLCHALEQLGYGVIPLIMGQCGAQIRSEEPTLMISDDNSMLRDVSRRYCLPGILAMGTSTPQTSSAAQRFAASKPSVDVSAYLGKQTACDEMAEALTTAISAALEKNAQGRAR